MFKWNKMAFRLLTGSKFLNSSPVVYMGSHHTTPEIQYKSGKPLCTKT